MELFLVPWNSMEPDKFDVLENHISEHCCWYLIDNYMLFGLNLTETLHIALISISSFVFWTTQYQQKWRKVSKKGMVLYIIIICSLQTC